MSLLLALLLSCVSDKGGDDGRPRPDDTAQLDDTGTAGTDGGSVTDGGSDGGTADDTGTEPTEPLLVVEEIGDQDPDLDGWIFDPLVIHQVEITLPEDSVRSLDLSPYSYAEGAISFDGIVLPTVGVRLRGKIGSFRYLSGKPKFKIDLNQYIDGQRLTGVETLSLNNSVVDCSYLKEPIAYRVMREAGVSASRTSFAQVTVNGSDYGLYVMVETPDDRFLVANFDDPTGNLYDGKYVYYPNGSYELLDFATGDDLLFQLEEGTDVGNEDIIAVSAAVTEWWGTGRFEEQVGELVDFDLLHRGLAAEQWVGHVDGYAMNTNNYRVYFDPSDGLMKYIPWDFDYSFIQDWEWGMSWGSPRGSLASGCWNDEHCLAAQADAVAELTDTIDGVDLVGFYRELADLTADAALADPRRECSWSYVVYYRNLVRDFTVGRSDSLRATWGL